jgi:hypothetical protein
VRAPGRQALKLLVPAIVDKQIVAKGVSRAAPLVRGRSIEDDLLRASDCSMACGAGVSTMVS